MVYGFATMLPRGRGHPTWRKLAVDWLRTPRFRSAADDQRQLLGDGFNLSYLFERKQELLPALARLVGWVEDGSLAPPRVTELPLEQVADAHRALESGTTTGKLVLLTRLERQ